MIWLPGLCALAVALALAALVLRANPAPTTATDDDMAARNEREVELVLDQLRELTLEEHLFDPNTYSREKARLEQSAAAALRARDAYHPKAQSVVPETARRPGFARRHPQLAGALWGAGAVGFAWALSTQVIGASKAREMASQANYDALLVLSAIALEQGDAEQFLQSWVIYMRQDEPRRRPPQLQRATDWLEEHLDKD